MAGLSFETCEAIVAALRLLHDCGSELPLTASRCTPFACAFLALASTVRSFEEAQGLPAPGEFAVISGLQSDSGLLLNGMRAIVERFHPESGRFIVRLRLDDPPSAWKKVRVENLLPEASPFGSATTAADGARECGRACLQGVAEVFDDLLHEMQATDLRYEEAVMAKVLHSQLAAAMWEALICCWGDGGEGLRGLQLLELCGGDFSLCSHLANDVLASGMALQLGLGFGVPEDEARSLARLRGLQELMVRAYCDLFQPSALWGVDGRDPGESSILQLQQDLDRHVLKVASCAVDSNVFVELAQVTEFHLSCVHTYGSLSRRGPPVALLVLLFRTVCTVFLASLDAAGAMLQRHLLLLMPDLLCVLVAFVDVLAAKQDSEDLGDYLAAAPAALEGLVAMAALGMWSTCSQAAWTFVTRPLLDMPGIVADPSLLARLALAMLSLPPEPSLAAGYEALCPAGRQLFWQQVAARGRLLRLEPGEAVRQVQEWLQVQPPGALEMSFPQARPHSCEASAVEAAAQLLISRCLADLATSLRDGPALAPSLPPLAPPASLDPSFTELLPLAPPASLDPSVAPSWPPLPAPTSLDQPSVALATAEVMAAAAPGGPAKAPAALSLLGLPALPGQQPRGPGGAAAAAAAGLRKQRGISREEVAGMRGINPARAPDELRCAIDGKLLGMPLRSPHGLLFERGTLEAWFERCGSVCPVTGQALRLEACLPDPAVERQVVEWVRAERAEHKCRAEERRARKGLASPHAGDGSPVA